MTDQNQPVPEPVNPGMPECGDAKPRKSGLATASLVLGIIGFITCGITAVIGLILGIVSLVQIGKDKSLIGQKLAVAGVVVSSIAIVCIPIMAIMGAIMFPVFMKAKTAAQSTTCMSNVRKITEGMMIYSNEHDGTLPPSAKWADSISVYLVDKNVLRCPTAKSTENCYGMNSKLSGISIAKIKDPVGTALIFDSKPGANPNGGSELLPSPSRHYGESIMGFADGHVSSVPDEELASVIWDPMPK